LVTIKPFPALRAKTDLAKQIASFPYDVINSDEARKLARDNPYSFLHIVKSEIDLPPQTELYSNEVYQKARENLAKFEKAKWLQKDPQPNFYLYQQKMGEHQQLGLVAVCSIDDYDQNKIKKHEKTRPDKEDDRTQHILTLSAQAEPVFLAYRDEQGIHEIAARWAQAHSPIFDFIAEDGIAHTGWAIDDEQVIANLTQQFSKIDSLYIADGHHRSASSSRARQKLSKQNPHTLGTESCHYVLAVIFPDQQLKVLPYNRVVKDLNGLTEEDFLKKVKEHFEIQPTNLSSPATPKTYSMYLNAKWYVMTPKLHVSAQKNLLESLDVAVLQNYLLGPILGIDDPRTSKRIDFVGGIRGTEELVRLVDTKKFQVAFSLYPSQMQEVMAIADQGLIMPPKSTWFEPKLRSGLFIHQF